MTDDKKDELLAEENNLISIRRKKLSEIRATREAYPNDFKKGVSAAWIHSEFEKMEKPELEEISQEVSAAGRIVRMRGPFIVILDEGVYLQLYLNSKALPDDRNCGNSHSLSQPICESRNRRVFLYGRGIH